MRLFATCAAWLLAACACGSAVAEPALAPDRKVIAKLQSLPPNHGVLLGEARVLGEFNATARGFNLHKTGPRSRDFSLKMVWAPERSRALYLGANHRVPHRLNDVWEFDLGALAWVLLYAPDNPRDTHGLGEDASDVEFRDGILVTKRGGPAVIAHTWWGVTWDPERRELLFMNTWVTNLDKAIARVGGDAARRYDGPPLWAFAPESRQWRTVKTPEPAPRAPFAAWLEFVPQLGGALWHARGRHGSEDWLYDPARQTWKPLTTRGEAPKPEQVGYLDPRRDLLVAQHKHDTYHLDLATLAWRKVVSGNEADSPLGHDAFAPMYHDPDSGHGLLFERKTNTLWAYDPDRTSWTRLSPQGDPMPKGKRRLAYFDPAHRVFVVIDDTRVWAYRYR